MAPLAGLGGVLQGASKGEGYVPISLAEALPLPFPRATSPVQGRRYGEGQMASYYLTTSLRDHPSSFIDGIQSGATGNGLLRVTWTRAQRRCHRDSGVCS